MAKTVLFNELKNGDKFTFSGVPGSILIKINIGLTENAIILNSTKENNLEGKLVSICNNSKVIKVSNKDTCPKFVPRSPGNYLSDKFTEHFNPCLNSHHVCPHRSVVTCDCKFYDSCILRREFNSIYEFLTDQENNET